MTGYTPEQLPVLSSIARDFGVFDHWFCEVPSQTFMNRSFWTAATSSGLVVNSPAAKWLTKNTAETLFERLEAHGKTWKVYVAEPMPLSFTGVIHFPRVQERLATHFVPFAEFEKDAAAGTLPDFSLIEPDMASGHNDYHPAYGRSLIGANLDIGFDPPSSMLGGEAFLERIYDTYRSMTAAFGHQRLEHRPADRLGRARRHLRSRRSRPRSAPGRGRASGRTRLHVRPLGLPGPRHHRVAVGRAGLGVQRGVPAHLADRHAPQDVGPRRGRSPAVTPRRAPSTTSSPSTTPRDPDSWVTVRSTTRARVDARHSVRRDSTQHAGQGHRSRPDRASQEDGRNAAAGARRSQPSVHP